jgi:hypothetical protein
MAVVGDCDKESNNAESGRGDGIAPLSTNENQATSQ